MIIYLVFFALIMVGILYFLSSLVMVPLYTWHRHDLKRTGRGLGLVGRGLYLLPAMAVLWLGSATFGPSLLTLMRLGPGSWETRLEVSLDAVGESHSPWPAGDRRASVPTWRPTA